MLIAMGLAASLCIGIGVFPSLLYGVLPFQVDYEPYTATHVITQLQLLFWSAVAFAWLNWVGLYPPELRSVNLDSDWIYRRLVPSTLAPVIRAGARLWNGVLDRAGRRITATLQTVHRHHGPEGILERTWPTGSMALWVAVLLAILLLLYFF